MQSFPAHANTRAAAQHRNGDPNEHVLDRVHRPADIRSTAPAYNYALGYLKACIIALVVAHHASLAYHPSARPIPASLLSPVRTWQTNPVVDAHPAWAGVFATFNDIFFMALMFLVSELFVWRSLTSKGADGYMRDRLLRIGLPFIPVAVILAPLSFYPTYLQISGPRELR